MDHILRKYIRITGRSHISVKRKNSFTKVRCVIKRRIIKLKTTAPPVTKAESLSSVSDITLSFLIPAKARIRLNIRLKTNKKIQYAAEVTNDAASLAPVSARSATGVTSAPSTISCC